MPSIDGLATGIDTTTIINGLLSIQQNQIDTLNARKKTIVDQQTAFGGIEAKLLALQSKLNDLSRPSTNAFERKSITSSDETVVTATVSNDAANGIYALRIEKLAHNHQIASQVYNRADATIAQGQMTLQIGSNAPVNLRITSANNTLEGLANAINASSHDVTASVMRDGSNYRLLLAGNQSGATNVISYTFTPDNVADASIAPTFDLNNPVQAASDAQIQIGSGDGAIVTTLDTNQVDDLFTGITMNLHKAVEGQEVTLTVSADTEAATTAINDFVTAYNDVMDFTSKQNQFDPTTQSVSTLFGNRTLISIRDSLSQMISAPISGVKGNRPNRLSSLGIRPGDNGKLTVNSTALNKALSGSFGKDIISASDIAAVFGYSGTTDNDHVTFIDASSKTVMSQTRLINDVVTVVPYKVNITRAAKQGQIASTSQLASSIVINSSNNTFNLSVDNRSSKDMTLTSGTYTPEQLADEVEKQINSNDELAGRTVRADVTDGKLRITSMNYGISSEISNLSGTALNDLGFLGSESGRGENVTGEYVLDIDGTTIHEAAAGQGRVLSGLDSNKYTAGLKVQTTLVQDQIPQGGFVTAELKVSRGIAESVDGLISSLMRNDSERIDGKTRQKVGLVTSAKNEFTEQINSVDASIERLNARFEAQKQALVAQFAGMESRVSDLQSVGSLLGAQLTSLSSFR